MPLRPEFATTNVSKRLTIEELLNWRAFDSFHRPAIILEDDWRDQEIKLEQARCDVASALIKGELIAFGNFYQPTGPIDWDPFNEDPLLHNVEGKAPKYGKELKIRACIWNCCGADKILRLGLYHNEGCVAITNEEGKTEEFNTLYFNMISFNYEDVIKIWRLHDSNPASSSFGPKPGKIPLKRRACEIAEELLNGGGFIPGRGTATKIGGEVLIRLEKETGVKYGQSWADKTLRAVFVKWEAEREKKHSGK